MITLVLLLIEWVKKDDFEEMLLITAIFDGLMFYGFIASILGI